MLLYYTANINIQHWILENPLNIVNIILFLFLHPRLYYKKYMFLNINIFPYCRFCKNVFSWFARVLHEILCVCVCVLVFKGAFSIWKFESRIPNLPALKWGSSSTITTWHMWSCRNRYWYTKEKEYISVS